MVAAADRMAGSAHFLEQHLARLIAEVMIGMSTALPRLTPAWSLHLGSIRWIVVTNWLTSSNAESRCQSPFASLPGDLIAVYRVNGFDLAKFNGDESWRLSMPARIVIQCDGIVVSAEVDPDYTYRPEPEDTMAVSRTIQRRSY